MVTEQYIFGEVTSQKKRTSRVANCGGKSMGELIVNKVKFVKFDLKIALMHLWADHGIKLSMVINFFLIENTFTNL